MATERHAQFVLRPEHDEWDLLKQNPRLFDAVLVRESYVAPYPPGHHFGNNEPTRLVDVAREAGVSVWRDPETPGLCSRTVLKLPSTKRLLLTPLAREFPLPLDLALFARSNERQRALELTLATQVSSDTAAGPYFNFDRRDSHAFRVNLEMTRETVRSVSEQVPTAFVQITVHRLLTGFVAAVAADYATVGVKRVLIRVRGLKTREASAKELAAYLDALAAFRTRGVEAVADCTGLLGPVLVAGGADGFSTGTRFFTSVPSATLDAGEGGGGTPIAAQHLGSFTEVDRPMDQEVRDTRVANMENLRALTQLAARDPDAIVATLRGEGGHSAIWASVLAERKRRAA